MNIFDCKNQIIKFMKQWQKLNVEESIQLENPQSIKEERLKSKYLYKTFLIILKYTPVILIMVEILYSVFAYFGIDLSWLSYIGGVSVANLLYLYIGSYVFKFCYLYRLSLLSILLVNIIAAYDIYIGIPLDDLLMLRLYLIVLLIGLVSYLKFHVKNNRKSI